MALTPFSGNSTTTSLVSTVKFLAINFHNPRISLSGQLWNNRQIRLQKAAYDCTCTCKYSKLQIMQLYDQKCLTSWDDNSLALSHSSFLVIDWLCDETMPSGNCLIGGWGGCVWWVCGVDKFQQKEIWENYNIAYLYAWRKRWVQRHQCHQKWPLRPETWQWKRNSQLNTIYKTTRNTQRSQKVQLH